MGEVDLAYLAEARSLARLLQAFGRERDGSLVFPSDVPNYMAGYAGVAVCLLRLGDAEGRPAPAEQARLPAPAVHVEKRELM